MAAGPGTQIQENISRRQVSEAFLHQHLRVLSGDEHIRCHSKGQSHEFLLPGDML